MDALRLNSRRQHIFYHVGNWDIIVGYPQFSIQEQHSIFRFLLGVLGTDAHVESGTISNHGPFVIEISTF